MFRRVVIACLMRLYKGYLMLRGLRIGNKSFLAPFSYLKNKRDIYIGNNCYIGPNSRLEAWETYGGECYKPVIKIGNRVEINSRIHIGAISRVEIGDNCLIGSNVFITDHSHGTIAQHEINMHPSDRPLFSKGGVTIGDNTWIGEYAVILPGVTIGKGCIVGASAVVTKSCPNYCVIAGNPARIVKYIDK